MNAIPRQNLPALMNSFMTGETVDIIGVDPHGNGDYITKTGFVVKVEKSVGKWVDVTAVTTAGIRFHMSCFCVTAPRS